MDAKAPSKGPAKAKATIVEYSDFQCPHCSRMAVEIEALQKKFPDQVRVVWMDFPLPFHAYAMIAHEAAAEAQAQGKFWEMQQWIFSNQGKVFAVTRHTTREELEANKAKVRQTLIDGGCELGLDRHQLTKSLDDHAHGETVMDRVAMGDAIGVTGTPTVFVNGVEIGYDFELVEAAVKKALK